nr:hypothetical protein [Mycobacterium leprae]
MVADGKIVARVVVGAHPRDLERVRCHATRWASLISRSGLTVEVGCGAFIGFEWQLRVRMAGDPEH